MSVDTNVVVMLYRASDGTYSGLSAQSVVSTGLDTTWGIAVDDVDGNGWRDVAVAGSIGSKPSVSILFRDSADVPTGGVYRTDVQNFQAYQPDIDDGFGSDVIIRNLKIPVIGARKDLAVSMDMGNSVDPGRQRFGVLFNQGSSGGVTTWTGATKPGRDSMGIDSGKFSSYAGPGRDLALSDSLSTISSGSDAHAVRRLGFSDWNQPDTYLLDTYSAFAASGVAVGAIDLNSSVDFVVSCRDLTGAGGPYGGVAVFQNKGDGSGTFWSTPRTFFTAATEIWDPYFVKIADMDDDARPDIVVSNKQHASIGVLINRTVQPGE